MNWPTPQSKWELIPSSAIVIQDMDTVSHEDNMSSVSSWSRCPGWCLILPKNAPVPAEERVLVEIRQWSEWTPLFFPNWLCSATSVLPAWQHQSCCWSLAPLTNVKENGVLLTYAGLVHEQIKYCLVSISLQVTAQAARQILQARIDTRAGAGEDERKSLAMAVDGTGTSSGELHEQQALSSIQTCRPCRHDSEGPFVFGLWQCAIPLLFYIMRTD